MKVEQLNIGDNIQYNGEMIIMRDAAQKRLSQFHKCPIDLAGKFIFYAGPAKKSKDSVVGAIGPTTSARMDKTLEMLFRWGIKATIGKGERSDLVRDLCKDYKSIYCITPSGCAAGLSKKVIEHKILMFEELQSEAIQKILVKDFPLIVAINSQGHTIWD